MKNVKTKKILLLIVTLIIALMLFGCARHKPQQEKSNWSNFVKNGGNKISSIDIGQYTIPSLVSSDATIIHNISVDNQEVITRLITEIGNIDNDMESITDFTDDIMQYGLSTAGKKAVSAYFKDENDKTLFELLVYADNSADILQPCEEIQAGEAMELAYHLKFNGNIYEVVKNIYEEIGGGER